MDGVSTPVDIMRRRYSTFHHLVSMLRSTESVNKVLSQYTSFQFPVNTGDSNEDILAYYSTLVSEDNPEEYTGLSTSELGDYIKKDHFGSVYVPFEKVSREGVSNDYGIWYMSEVLTDILQEQGPWSLTGYYENAKRDYKNPTMSAYELFDRLGLGVGLVYCPDIPNRAALIDKLTDEACLSESRFRWLMGSTKITGTHTLTTQGCTHVRSACFHITMIKTFNRSESVTQFKKKFISMFKYFSIECMDAYYYGDNYLHLTVASFCARMLLQLGGRNYERTREYSRVSYEGYADFNLERYIDYYMKTIVYVLELCCPQLTTSNPSVMHYLELLSKLQSSR